MLLDGDLLLSLDRNDADKTILKLEQVNDGDVKGLVAVLLDNTHVKELYLNGAGIDKSAIDLAHLLNANRSLKVLDLSCNYIQDEYAIKLASALKTNDSLIELNLSDNPISNEGLSTIVQLLLNGNASLKKLHLDKKSYYDPLVLARLRNGLKNNYILVELPGFNKDDCLEKINEAADGFTKEQFEQIAGCLEEIECYLDRNKSLAGCLEPIDDFYNTLESPSKQQQLNASDSIQTKSLRLNRLKKCIEDIADFPDFKQLGRRHYVTKIHRLLNALLVMDENFKEAAMLLKAPFKHKSLQAKADLMRGMAYLSLFETEDMQDKEYETARSLLILYYLRNELHRKEVKERVHPYLARFWAEIKPDMGDFNQLLDTELINYATMIMIAKRASTLVGEESDEAGILNNILQHQGGYRAKVSDVLWQLPSFIQSLKQGYPQANKFLVIEDTIRWEKIKILTLVDATPEATAKESLDDATVIKPTMMSFYSPQPQKAPPPLLPTMEALAVTGINNGLG